MEARLCFIGHGLMENRSGLMVDAPADPRLGPRRTAALDLVQQCRRPPVRGHLGADRGYDEADFVEELRGKERAPARSPEHQRPALGDRQAHDPAYRLR